MITELPYIAYFENLAAKNKQINHTQQKAAFFYLPNEWQLTEIDNAIRSGKGDVLFLLDGIAGNLNDNGSASHHETINGQFFIIKKWDSKDNKSIRACRDVCLDIGRNILGRMIVDRRAKQLIDPNLSFTLTNVAFDPVGPMATDYYGYTFRFKIACPFGFSVDSATWSDK